MLSSAWARGGESKTTAISSKAVQRKEERGREDSQRASSEVMRRERRGKIRRGNGEETHCSLESRGTKDTERPARKPGCRCRPGDSTQRLISDEEATARTRLQEKKTRTHEVVLPTDGFESNRTAREDATESVEKVSI